ncbi:hypothetical protein BaRGS_00016991 [Batillaria attramentaria]|uniref:Uncharacterized protein n=1 Tax=Batillaria attramentaria TaxID=370345 RepID=A0ABD0KX41_9CAEN
MACLQGSYSCSRVALAFAEADWHTNKLAGYRGISQEPCNYGTRKLSASFNQPSNRNENPQTTSSWPPVHAACFHRENRNCIKILSAAAYQGISTLCKTWRGLHTLKDKRRNIRSILKLSIESTTCIIYQALPSKRLPHRVCTLV